MRDTENRPLLGAFEMIPVSRVATEGDAGGGPTARLGGGHAIPRPVDQILPTSPVFDDALPVVSRFAHPADVALSAGIAHRARDGFIVFHPPAGETPEPPLPADPLPVPVQRAADDAPSTPTITASAAPAPAAAAGGAGGDLDDLARKLYPKIRPYLKKELWLDRERAGLLTSSGR
ncbi:MAG: hypothetical protein E6G66_07665 [Actinobacteria bacterium]|nr:MAG: hypothetical protein E6G66_07665 [Actinomycetota bacterium]